MTCLNADRIRASVSKRPRARLDSLEVFSEIDSTNKYLLEQPAPVPGRFAVALAEHQTAGRGRFNRNWYSAPAASLCLSMSYTFANQPRDIASLTLAIGAGVAETLERLGIGGIGLKWPNDIVIADGKVGGILCEVQPVNSEGVTVVVGIGLNVDLRQADGLVSRIGRIADMASGCDELPSKSEIAAVLTECLFNTMEQFAAEGFAPLIDTWRRFDWLRGQQITIELTEERIPGIAQGIDIDGTLILETESGRQRIGSGSVQLNGNAGCKRE
ncbi:MAG: biotin--[acetyl-CoA-carboxylase] ligase [Gammaproteobacteria bacterium]|nr:MAG: biotin--[acetyl-CoA-carboxylase] ligase [Gammaproteobacteria bacterium]